MVWHIVNVMCKGIALSASIISFALAVAGFLEIHHQSVTGEYYEDFWIFYCKSVRVLTFGIVKLNPKDFK